MPRLLRDTKRATSRTSLDNEKESGGFEVKLQEAWKKLPESFGQDASLIHAPAHQWVFLLTTDHCSNMQGPWYLLDQQKTLDALRQHADACRSRSHVGSLQREVPQDVTSKCLFQRIARDLITAASTAVVFVDIFHHGCRCERCRGFREGRSAIAPNTDLQERSAG